MLFGKQLQLYVKISLIIDHQLKLVNNMKYVNVATQHYFVGQLLYIPTVLPNKVVL